MGLQRPDFAAVAAESRHPPPATTGRPRRASTVAGAVAAGESLRRVRMAEQGEWSHLARAAAVAEGWGHPAWMAVERLRPARGVVGE